MRGSWIGLDQESVAQVKAMADATSLADNVAPLSGHVLESMGSGHDEYLLLRVDGQQLAGVAVARERDPVELFVPPAHRRRGHGKELVDRALARSGAVWAHGDLPAARALADRLGLVKSRELLQMRRSLSRDWAAAQIAAAPVPAGIRLRSFVPGRDEEQFLLVNSRAFDWHPEQGRLNLAGLQAEMAQAWFDAEGFLLAVDEADTVLGFHWTKIHPAGPGAAPVAGPAAAASAARVAAPAPAPAASAAPVAGSAPEPGRVAGVDPAAESVGEVYVLGVDPSARVAGAPVRGLGAPLTAAGLAYLAARGQHRVLLYVEGDNVKALNLYSRMGFRTVTSDVVYRLPD